ncbi:BamA/TamA family outer membrane protein [Halpernia frigidisoli]|uniref:hypothetical protein n=1 Tax=Halpernia frigidisoli TaxID=1125876 RepID=UPI001F2293D2|nr:hypothetical protein [Halpernia frigidisoli]
MDSISAVKFLDSLSQNSYYLTEVKNVIKKENLTEIYFDKKQNFNQANVHISDSLAKELKLPQNFTTKNLDSLKQNINKIYRNKGFSFNRIKTKFNGFKNEVPQIDLEVATSNKRTIDKFVLKDYTKVPKRFVKNLEEDFLHKIYDDKNLLKINNSLQNHPFVLLERPPQTLFKKDSTEIFLFLKKKVNSTFDGIIGFGNDKTEKFTLNGSLNLNLKNVFNGFETIGLYWQRNPDSGQTFNLGTDIPYLFQSKVGLNLNVNIYRQDSTFATVKAVPGFYYHISNNQKIGFRGTFETSAILDSLYTGGKDYTKQGIGLCYQYSRPTEIEIFQYQTNINSSVDYLRANYTDQKYNQIQYFLKAESNFHLTGNHYVNVNGESSLINSKNQLNTNELFRFGGWNSLRGFNENSLFADFYAFGGAEYRYLVNTQTFFDVFGQYAVLNNPNLNAQSKLYSLGFGFKFFMQLGLMSVQISNGSQFGEAFNFKSTKISWGLLSRF